MSGIEEMIIDLFSSIPNLFLEIVIVREFELLFVLLFFAKEISGTKNNNRNIFFI